MRKEVSRVVIGFLSGVLFVACLGVAGGDEKETSAGQGTDQEIQVGPTDYHQSILDNYQVYSMPLPDQLTFSNEEVPLENLLVQEALDKEIHTNAYWHSNTFFYLKRAHRWFNIIEPILKEQGIPDDFKYLAVIESGLINATSPSGAKGFWQFMSKTATAHGLEVSEDVDERNNLVKATYAACEYLNDAYDKFGSWTLAAASYNMGKTGLENQLLKQKVSNYYDVLLNIETGRYVYRILAVKCIFENPKQYGFNFREEDLYPPFQTQEMTVDSTISSLVDFAIDHETNYKTLKVLNPWLINDKLTVKSGKVYTVLLPEKGKGLDQVSPEQLEKK